MPITHSPVRYPITKTREPKRVPLIDENGFVPGSETTAWQSHRTANQTFSANVWTDIVWDLKIDSLCLPGINYLNEGEASEDTSILVISGFNDILKVSGCFHSDWTGSSGTSVKTFGRGLLSTDQGSTWTEIKCLQVNEVEAKGSNAEGSMEFAGSISVNGETWLKIQFRTDSSNLRLAGNSVFDDGVAATITIDNIGNNKKVS